VALAKDIKPPFGGTGVPVTVRAATPARGAAEWGFGSALHLSCMGHAPRNKPKRLGEKLKQIREALGLSRRELAEQLSERTGFTITRAHVANYELNRVEPFLETTLAYARLANVEMNEIADDDLDLSL